MSPEEAADKVRAQLDAPVTEVHMVAGVWPKLSYEYYLELLRAVKAARPESAQVATALARTAVRRRAARRCRDGGCAFAPRCARAMAQCGAERPRLEELGGHAVACWDPVGI